MSNLAQVFGDSFSAEEVNAWLNVDGNEAISSQLTEDDIINSVVEEPVPESDSEDEEEAEPIPSMKSVVQSRDNTEVGRIAGELHQAKVEARKTCKQSKITDFFSAS